MALCIISVGANCIFRTDYPLFIYFSGIEYRCKHSLDSPSGRGGTEEIIMKIQNVTDVEGFFELVDHCKGKVELVTGEGDRLNLKSKLSQYVSLARIFADDMIPEMELVVYDPEDAVHFINYMAGDATRLSA